MKPMNLRHMAPGARAGGIPFIVAILIVTLLAPAAAAQTTFEFELGGDQEVPPVATAASGTAVGILDASETVFDLTVVHDVANPTMAHIHLGGPGTNGPVVFDLGVPTSPIHVSWNLTPSDVSDLLSGDLYVNVHSTEHPSGEIRGQILQDCKPGTINSGAGAVADVLFINGTTGDEARELTVEGGESFLWGTILLPPAGGNGKFVVHGNLGRPSGSTARVLPADLGTFCFPLLLGSGATPVIVANNIGKESRLGSSAFFGTPTADPLRAPSIFLQQSLPEVNLPPGTTITFQGAAVDPASVSPKAASTTNAVIVEIQ